LTMPAITVTNNTPSQRNQPPKSGGTTGPSAAACEVAGNSGRPPLSRPNQQRSRWKRYVGNLTRRRGAPRYNDDHVTSRPWLYNAPRLSSICSQSSRPLLSDGSHNRSPSTADPDCSLHVPKLLFATSNSVGCGPISM